MADKSIVSNSKLTALGDAIRSKTGSTENLTLDNMVTAINNISGGSDEELKTFVDELNEKTASSIKIPAYFTKLGDYMLISMSNLTTIENPEIITELGSHNFQDMYKFIDFSCFTNLTKINDYIKHLSSKTSYTSNLILPNLESMGDYNFYYNDIYSNKFDFTNLKEMGNYNFYYISNKYNKYDDESEIILPNLESMGDYNFYSTMSKNNFANIKTFKLPKLKTIGNNNFNLDLFRDDAEVYLDVIENIGSYNFKDFKKVYAPKCYILEESAFNESQVRDLTLDFDNIVEIPNNCFYNCYLRSFNFGKSLTSIGEYAFYYCSWLNNIIIPANVSSIGSNAFYRTGWGNGNGTKLTITFESEMPATLSSGVFSKSNLNKIIVPKGCSATYKAATNWSTYADYIIEPSTKILYIDSGLLNNELFIYSTDGTTFNQFTSESITLEDTGFIIFKSTTASQTIIVGTTQGGSDIGTITNAQLTYTSPEDAVLYLTLQ